MSLEEFIHELHAEIDYEKYAACDDMTDGASDCPSCCGKQYFDGQEASYDCEQKRKVYVVRYLSVHVIENYYGSSLVPENASNILFSKEAVNVLSLGGGPGSDIAGFKRYVSTLDEEDCSCKIFNIFRLDKEDGWNDLSKRVNGLYHCDGRKFNHQRLKSDVCKDIKWLDGKSFDVVLISYLISELQQAEQIEMLVSNLKKCLTADSVLIINDRDQKDVNERIQRLVTKLNRNVVKSKLITSNCGVDFSADVKQKAKPKITASSKIHIC